MSDSAGEPQSRQGNWRREASRSRPAASTWR